MPNALAGVKRPALSNPTTVPTQRPAFRGVPNTPGAAIKAPKLSGGNRPNRGSNITVPYARVTGLTSLSVQNGRLSPGDVAFARRRPAGYASGTAGKFSYGGSALANFTDMMGVDGMNRLLSGTLGGHRAWKVGYNMVDETMEADVSFEPFGVFNDPVDATKPNGPTKPRVDGNGAPVPYLRALYEYRLDGAILSNEEPGSFAPTGERDATVFNMVVKGLAPVNNGFLTYDNHSATELYPRGRDPVSYQSNLRVGSDRAATTWHGKIGYDFVAAYTSVYSEFPLQMFDRKVRVPDTVYLVLRRYNLEEDVIQPRIGVLRLADSALTADVARASVVGQLNVRRGDDTRLQPADLTPTKAKKYHFFQYMPCSSTAFTEYHHVLKAVDAKLRAEGALSAEQEAYVHTAPGLGSAQFRDLRNGAAHGRRTAILATEHTDLTAKRAAAYKTLAAARQANEITTEHDAVRFLDLLHAAGAWQVGRVIDGRAAVAGQYAGGPTNSSYRMTVMIDIKWLPRNKTMYTDTVKETGDIVKRLGTRTAYLAAFSEAAPGSLTHRTAACYATHTLAERELFEGPVKSTTASTAAADATAAAATKASASAAADATAAATATATATAEAATQAAEAKKATDAAAAAKATKKAAEEAAAKEAAKENAAAAEAARADQNAAAARAAREAAAARATNNPNDLAAAQDVQDTTAAEAVAEQEAQAAASTAAQEKADAKAAKLTAAKAAADEKAAADKAAKEEAEAVQAAKKAAQAAQAQEAKEKAAKAAADKKAAAEKAAAKAAKEKADKEAVAKAKEKAAADAEAAKAAKEQAAADKAAKEAADEVAKATENAKAVQRFNDEAAARPTAVRAESNPVVTPSDQAPATVTQSDQVPATVTRGGSVPVLGPGRPGQSGPSGTLDAGQNSSSINANASALAPITAAATARAAGGAARRGRGAASTAASLPAPPAGVDTSPLVPTSTAGGGSIVDSVISQARRPADGATAARAQSAQGGVVDDVFSAIFGAGGGAGSTSAQAPGQSPLASPNSPTPSSGSESGPRAFSRRNR